LKGVVERQSMLIFKKYLHPSFVGYRENEYIFDLLLNFFSLSIKKGSSLEVKKMDACETGGSSQSNNII
jgi:hypothetical protein